MDPQIAAWLLDPADSASCFQTLLSKHYTRPVRCTSLQPVGHAKVSMHTLVLTEGGQKMHPAAISGYIVCRICKLIDVTLLTLLEKQHTSMLVRFVLINNSWFKLVFCRS